MTGERLPDKDLAEAIQWAAQKSLEGVYHALVELQERRAAGYAAGSREADALRDAARDALDAHSFDCCEPMQRLKAALKTVPGGMEELRGGLRGH